MLPLPCSINSIILDNSERQIVSPSIVRNQFRPILEACLNVARISASVRLGIGVNPCVIIALPCTNLIVSP